MAEQTILGAITHIVASLASDQPPSPDTIELPGGDSREKKDLEVELRRLATLVNQRRGQPPTITPVDGDWQFITTSDKPCPISDASFQTASEDVAANRQNNVDSHEDQSESSISESSITDTTCPCATDSWKRHRAQAIAPFAGLFNEMRTPLNGIAGLTEMALGTGLTGHQRDILAEVKTSATSAITIVNDMMDYIQIESGTMSLVRQSFHLRQTVFGALQQAMHKPWRSTSINFYVDELIPEKVLGDAYRVARVIKTIIAAAGNHRSYGCGFGLMITKHIEANANEPRKDALEFVLSDVEGRLGNDTLGSLVRKMNELLNSEPLSYTYADIAPLVSQRLIQFMGGKMWTSNETRPQLHFTLPLTVARSNISEIFHQLRPYQERCILLSQELADSPLRTHRMLRDANLQLELMPYPLNAPEPTAQSLIALARRTDVIVVGSTASAKRVRSKKEFDAVPVVVVMTSKGSITLTSTQQLDICACVPKSCDFEHIGSALITAFGSTPVGLSRYFETNALDILVAEDNRVNQRLLKKILEKFSHNITIVPDGSQAVEAAQKKSYDVILMDISMPIMSGLEASARIREYQQSTASPRIPIVAMVAGAALGQTEEWNRAQFDGYISKPVRRGDLTKAIMDVILSSE